MPPRRWTTEELETANTMMGEGTSFSDIAQKLDRTASAVESKLKGKKVSASGASTSKLKPKPNSVADATPQPAKASISTPQHAPATDAADDGDSSMIKYIVGAVIVAVIIWLIMD
ncbi:MAG: hypothetical protein CMD99_05125 [Gammaproteobacteria bacterium]|nr:hypothetical protein [Gammaproteobacteria bacterium]|tara:strand:- start:184 stop:528 length:345 start_codon:yes stop_codon:yes gene_type:complete